MKILLIKPPEPQKADNTISGHIIEHLGIGYIASMLRKNGYEVQIVDGRISGLNMEQLEELILTAQFDVLGISIPYQWSMPEVLSLTKNLRKRGMKNPLFVGGHPATFFYKEILEVENGVDFVCIGEGEYSVLELIQAMENNSSYNDIKGIAFRYKGQVEFTGYRELINDLDAIPFPARDTLAELLQKAPYVSISICGSRGCSWSSCSFCDVQSFYRLCKGKKWRARSIKNIIDEIEMLQKKYGHSKFSFVDDDFFGPKSIREKRITELCDEIEKRKLDIHFSLLCNVRDIDEAMLTRMKQDGLYGLFLGVESGVQRCLDTFHKGVTVQENRSAIIRAQKLDLGVACGSIFIDPYTKLDEIKENVEFWDGVNEMSIEKYKSLMIFQGTPLLEKLKNEGKLIYKDYDYTYDHVLPADVVMVNKCVSDLNELFMNDIMFRPKMIEKRAMIIMKACGINEKEIEKILALTNQMHSELCNTVFTKVLKRILDCVNEFTDENYVEKIRKFVTSELSDFNKMKSDLEKEFALFMNKHKDNIPNHLKRRQY